jgi:diguanylate cyclase (GGDEF)-like protein/putative nucleotidyltransferase with HDIG domain
MRRLAQSRVQSVLIGAAITAIAAAAGTAYCLATWSGPNRTAIICLFAAGALAGHLPLAYGAERIVDGRHRERFFLAWSSGMIAITAALVALDGGTGSPLALLFFITVVFVGLSYPQRSVIAIGALDVLAFVAVGLATGSSQVTLAFFTVCLAMVALLCAWEALAHERQRDALNRVSRADPLTGCLNRRGFEERVDAELDGCRRQGRSAALVMLDLDDFKLVNDTRGHEAGDELLCWTAERAREQLRPMDALGRPGGDEFAVLVPGAGPHEAREVASRLRDALGERVSVSSGIASFPIDAEDRESLHRSADRDLYAAKHGRAPEAGPGTRELAWAAALAHAVDLRAAVPDEHSRSVAAYSAAIAQRLGWSGGELALLRMAAMLHDVGKVSVPDRVLQKTGPLTADEFDLVKTHPEAGAEIVEQVDGLSPVVGWIRHSHEHFDGSGYPDGLAGEEIPPASRILLVAEAFDAMTSRRPYGSPRPPELALEELRTCAGGQFDADCVAALEEHLELVAA